MTINELWHSGNAHAWNQALKRYMRFVKPADVELIRELEPLNLERIREPDAQGWYDFLFDKYFRWMYTAANRLATTRRSLSKYTENGRIDELLSIKEPIQIMRDKSAENNRTFTMDSWTPKKIDEILWTYGR